MKKYTFYWLDGTIETMTGYGVADAFMKLGYGQGAITALDYYKEEDSSCSATLFSS